MNGQTPGMEEFELLKRELRVNEGLEDLDQKIHSLYELSRIHVEQRENKVLSLIAVFGVPLALIPLLWEMRELIPIAEGIYAVIAWAAGAITLLGIWLWHKN